MTRQAHAHLPEFSHAHGVVVQIGVVRRDGRGGSGVLGRRRRMLLLLPTRGRPKKGRCRGGGRGEGGKRGGGKDGGGDSSGGCVAEVQGCDDGRHWTAQVAVRVDCAFPLHPCAPVLRGMWDGGTDRGRR